MSDISQLLASLRSGSQRDPQKLSALMSALQLTSQFGGLAGAGLTLAGFGALDDEEEEEDDAVQGPTKTPKQKIPNPTPQPAPPPQALYPGHSPQMSAMQAPVNWLRQQQMQNYRQRLAASMLGRGGYA